MKKEAPRRGNSGARDQRAEVRATTSNSATACNSPIPSAFNSAQDQNQCLDIAHIGAIWKSPRDKRQCIQAAIKSFNGSPPYLDLRLFEMDAQGRMRATSKGITISASRLFQLAKLVGDAARKAQALGLTRASS